MTNKKLITANEMWLFLYSHHVADKTRDMPCVGSPEYNFARSIFFQALKTYITKTSEVLCKAQLTPHEFIDYVMSLDAEICGELEKIRNEILNAEKR